MIIRHHFRPGEIDPTICMCGEPRTCSWHQDVTEEDDAKYVAACKSLGMERAWAPQPPSRPGTVDIISLVHADLDARDRMGTKKYGTTLQAHNGRKPLVDAYQEALDLVMYLRQELEERTRRHHPGIGTGPARSPDGAGALHRHTRHGHSQAHQRVARIPASPPARPGLSIKVRSLASISETVRCDLLQGNQQPYI